MHIARPRRVAALLAVLALLLAAVPAGAAAPPTTYRPVANETGVRAPLVHALAAWLTSLWPGFGPQSAREELGIVADPDRSPQAIWEGLGSALDPDGSPESTSSVPTATPQLDLGHVCALHRNVSRVRDE